jgi:hypothetical protein
VLLNGSIDAEENKNMSLKDAEEYHENIFHKFVKANNSSHNLIFVGATEYNLV